MARRPRRGARRLSMGRRRVLREPDEPDPDRRDLRGELESTGGIRRTALARPCVIRRGCGVCLGLAVPEARLRPLAHGADRARGDDARGRRVRLHRAARHGVGLSDAHTRPLAGSLGHRLSLGVGDRRRQRLARPHAPSPTRYQPRRRDGVLLLRTRGHRALDLADGAIRRFALRRRAARHARSTAAHEHARPQRRFDSLAHFRVRGRLGRGVRIAVRVLPQVHPPRIVRARQLRRGVARSDRRRLGNAGRSNRRRRYRDDPQELRLGVRRALEHVARVRIRRDRALHAGRHRAGPAPLVDRVALEARVTAALALTGLRKAFGGLPATNDVSLAVAPGERRLIIGPNGAGKTTLFNLITGDLALDAGTIEFFGAEVSRLLPYQRAHLGLARTYQIITLFGKDTLEHNIVLALLGLSRVRWDTFRSLARYGSLYEEA